MLQRLIYIERQKENIFRNLYLEARTYQKVSYIALLELLISFAIDNSRTVLLLSMLLPKLPLNPHILSDVSCDVSAWQLINFTL